MVSGMYSYDLIVAASLFLAAGLVMFGAMWLQRSTIKSLIEANADLTEFIKASANTNAYLVQQEMESKDEPRKWVTVGGKRGVIE